ncbi:MAG: hypothetical protein EOM03_16025 [Clostridia bacterium]|nr:hypothetical protein [Clostridia bacterium]
MKLKTKEPTPVEDRPYPEGIAWDEALRQRKMKERYRKALETIAKGIEYRSAAPKMDGTFETHPSLMGRNRMCEFAQEVLEANYDE